MSLQQAYAEYGSAIRASNKKERATKTQEGLFDLAIQIGGMVDDKAAADRLKHSGSDEGIDLLKETYGDSVTVNKNWFGKTTGVNVSYGEGDNMVTKSFDLEDVSKLGADLPEHYMKGGDHMKKRADAWVKHLGQEIDVPKAPVQSVQPEVTKQNNQINQNANAAAGAWDTKVKSLYQGLDKKLGGVLPGGTSYNQQTSTDNTFSLGDSPKWKHLEGKKMNLWELYNDSEFKKTTLGRNMQKILESGDYKFVDGVWTKVKES